MLRSSIPALLLAIVTLVAADRADACGPDFPPSLLDDRARALQELPDGPFDGAMRQLVDGLAPPDPAWRVVEGYGDEDGDEGSGDGAGGGKSAPVATTDGERERALYLEGAAAFVAGNLDAAAARFAAVLALPGDQRRHRSTSAAFMLGRLDGFVRVSPRWQQTRQLASDGFDDDQGLATASLGEEARHLLDADGIVAAVTLYGRQARLGSDSGALSLLQVTRSVLDDVDGARREALLKSPVGRRLFAAYAFARGEERPTSLLPIVERLRQQARIEWGDHLAAALYRQGRTDDAVAVLDRSDETALSLWVRAKIASRRGQLDDARALLARASASFPPLQPTQPTKEPKADFDGDLEVDGGWWHPLARTPGARVLGERAVLSLRRGDYVVALEQLLQAESWWQDAAWVAERVLTVEELERFVSERAPVPVRVDDNAWGQPPDQRAALRALLARRLVREGRPDDAVAWFDDPRLKALLVELNATLQRARTAPHDADGELVRAEALFAAARLVRTDGFELRGTELAPDFVIWGGSHDTSLVWDDTKNEAVVAELKVSDVVSADEVRRNVDARPTPDARFHHRFVAMQLAEDAARHVPPTTQAYAALLCQATRWARRDTAQVDRIWRTYVEHGAVVDFTAAFGSADTPCPAPDFAALRARRDDARRAATVTLAARIGASAVALGAIVVVGVLLRRRRRPPPFSRLS